MGINNWIIIAVNEWYIIAGNGWYIYGRNLTVGYGRTVPHTGGISACSSKINVNNMA